MLKSLFWNRYSQNSGLFTRFSKSGLPILCMIIRDVNEARTLEAEARTLEAEARTLVAEAEARTFEAKAEFIQFWPSELLKFRRLLNKNSSKFECRQIFNVK